MEWLQKHFLEQPNKRFLDDQTFGDVYKQVQTVADSLSTAVSAVSRVALLSDNSVTMAVYLMALMLLHKEVLLLNVHLTNEEIRNQLDELEVNTVIASSERQAQLADVELVIVFDNALLEKARLADTCQDSLANASNGSVNQNFLDWSFDDSEIAAIMNTSATTGQFKAVPLRWGQIRAHVEASAQTLGVAPDDTWLMVLPLFHVSGLSILMRSLYNGTAIQIMEKLNRSELVRLINDREINMVSLVPTILKDVVGDITTHDMRVILLGGEFIPMPLIEACREKSLPIYKTYGMTETFSQSVTFSVLDHLDKIESVGRPLPGMTVRIVHPDADGVGEIHLNGPMLMDGYLHKESIDGEFNTDDIGYIDNDGYVYILNRRKDIIISGGENIYPKEIEDLLYTLSYVKECAVVPVEDERWGQVPALFVAVDTAIFTTSNGVDTSSMGDSKDETMAFPCSSIGNVESDRKIDLNNSVKQELRRFLSNHLGTYKIPKYIILLDSLPRNGTGKILRKDLQL